MKNQFKVRITCSHCLYSKIMPIHESDPLNTRHIITESCEKCCAESNNDIIYLNCEGDKLETNSH